MWINEQNFEGADQFAYLASVVSTDSGTELLITRHINSIMSDFIALPKIWKTGYLSVLLYGDSIWEMITTVPQKLEPFVYTYLFCVIGYSRLS